MVSTESSSQTRFATKLLDGPGAVGTMNRSSSATTAHTRQSTIEYKNECLIAVNERRERTKYAARRSSGRGVVVVPIRD